MQIALCLGKGLQREGGDRGRLRIGVGGPWASWEGGHLQGSGLQWEMKEGRERPGWYENMQLVKKRRKTRGLLVRNIPRGRASLEQMT